MRMHISKGGIERLVAAIIIIALVVALLISFAPSLSDSSKETAEKQIQSMTGNQTRIHKN